MENNYKVYVHQNKINGKLYVGQTKQSLTDRFGLNGQRYKRCTKFCNAIQKYGWHNFNHILILDNLTLDEANILESELIKKYDTINNGYNLTTGGSSEYQYPDEIRKQISLSRIGEKNPMYGVRLPQETIKHIIEARKGKIDVPVINIITLNKYNSMAQAHSETGDSIAKISTHCNLNKTIQKREWLKYDDYIKMSKQEIEYHKKKKSKRKQVINIKTKLIYENGNQVSIQTGESSGEINRSCNGAYKGGLWMYLEDYQLSSQDVIDRRLFYNQHPASIPVINLDTNKVYINAREAAIDCGHTERGDTTIRKCINGKYSTAFGYHWMDYEKYLKLQAS